MLQISIQMLWIFIQQMQNNMSSNRFNEVYTVRTYIRMLIIAFLLDQLLDIEKYDNASRWYCVKQSIGPPNYGTLTIR